VGDCLSNAITHLLKYSISFKMIQKNSMSHLKESLRLGTPKAYGVILLLFIGYLNICIIQFMFGIKTMVR
jgi:hypothetical protein